MELADGGDLFDKIEADEGVGEDVAHFYFTQLVSAVGYMHSRGIAHRDIKPENILLSGQGDLKIADFGLAALFMKGGVRRTCSTVCGSPPYVAPEVLMAGKKGVGSAGGAGSVGGGGGYAPDAADLWSCGIVLFVLLVGNTPWDEPTMRSPEFSEYVENHGRGTSDELWNGIPSEALSLLRGLLKLDAKTRFALEEVRKHPWFTRPNPLLSPAGTAANPLGLATKLLEALRVDFDTDSEAVIASSQRRSNTASNTTTSGAFGANLAGNDDDAMDIDTPATTTKPKANPTIHPNTSDFRLASTQPDNTTTAATAGYGDGDDDSIVPFEWETTGRRGSAALNLPPSASQPVTRTDRSVGVGVGAGADADVHWALESLVADDPTLSQFSSTPSVPLTLTQHARKFRDIVPAHSLTRFLSTYPLPLLVGLLEDALHRLGIPGSGVLLYPGQHGQGQHGQGQHGQDQHQHQVGIGDVPVARLQVRTTDGRGQMLHGNIVVEEISTAAGVEVKEVRFLKAKGDPVEWRRFFKRVCVLCKEGIYIPGG